MISLNRNTPVQPMEAKMLGNAQKALEEHQTISPVFSLGMPSNHESTPLLGRQLTFQHQIADDQGPRSDHQDASFYKEINQGILSGVFDGHGGAEVAEIASEHFSTHFSGVLDENNGDVHKAFNDLIQTIHQNVVEREDLKRQGTTAIVSFIEKSTNKIYTATLGDSEANIYRKQGDQLISIPLSCVRDWGSKKDAARLETELGLSPGMVARYIGKDSKKRKLVNTGGIPPKGEHPKIGLNVSRSIGDAKYKEGLVIQKPKITVSTLQQGDIVVLACDGLKDFVKEEEIISVIDNRVAHAKETANYVKELDEKAEGAKSIWTQIGIVIDFIIHWFKQLFQDNIAEGLVNRAIDAMIPGVTGGDNVTVVVIEVSGKKLSTP